MKLLASLTLYVECLYRLITRFIYFPTFKYVREVFAIENTHINSNEPLFRICFAAWLDKDGRLPEQRSSLSIHAVANSDPTLCDIYCCDTVSKLSSDHFMGTIKRGIDYDLSIDIETGNYHIAEVVVNVSPRTHYAPHTIKLTMPMYGKYGLIYKQ